MIVVRVDKIEAVARACLARAGVAGEAADRIIASAHESSAAWLRPASSGAHGPERELEGRLCGAFVSVAMLQALLLARTGARR